MSRYALRTDANQPDIIEAYEKAGCSVWVIGRPVDLLVGRAGVNYLIEVKDSPRWRYGRRWVGIRGRWRERD